MHTKRLQGHLSYRRQCSRGPTYLEQRQLVQLSAARSGSDKHATRATKALRGRSQSGLAESTCCTQNGVNADLFRFARRRFREDSEVASERPPPLLRPLGAEDSQIRMPCICPYTSRNDDRGYATPSEASTRNSVGIPFIVAPPSRTNACSNKTRLVWQPEVVSMDPTVTANNTAHWSTHDIDNFYFVQRRSCIIGTISGPFKIKI